MIFWYPIGSERDQIPNELIQNILSVSHLTVHKVRIAYQSPFCWVGLCAWDYFAFSLGVAEA